MTVNPTAMKWQCGRCNHWNKIENGKCASCGALSQQFATAFRLYNVLTAEESNFYKGTAPQILREIRMIRVLLDNIVKTKEERQMEEGRASELINQVWDLEAKITKMMNENRGARLAKEKPVHSYDVIEELQREKEKLIAERRELIIAQSTTQQENKTKGFTVTDGKEKGAEGKLDQGKGLVGTGKDNEILGEGEVPKEAPPKDGKPLTESEQIIAAVKAGKVADIMAAAEAKSNIMPFVRSGITSSIEKAGQEYKAVLNNDQKKRKSKATARQELAEEFIKLLEMIEKYYRQ